jgi:hypothetical protein
VGEAFLHAALAPGFEFGDVGLLVLRCAGGLQLLAVFDEAFGGVGAAVEEDILDEDEQFLGSISS